MTLENAMGIETTPGTRPRTGTFELVRARLVARIEGGEIELPLLPQVAGQVILMTADEKSDASKLSALIHQDQALAGHVPRIANSAALAGSSPILSRPH